MGSEGFEFGGRERGQVAALAAASVAGLVPHCDSRLCPSQTVGCGHSPGSLGLSGVRTRTKVSGPGR